MIEERKITSVFLHLCLYSMCFILSRGVIYKLTFKPMLKSLKEKTIILMHKFSVKKKTKTNGNRNFYQLCETCITENEINNLKK